MDNRQLTSTRNGILKADAVMRAAACLVDRNVVKSHELLALDGGGRAELRSAWTKVAGQRSGLSWSYLLLLAGEEEVKPDRMVVRFVAAAIGRVPSADEAAGLVRAAAEHLGVSVRPLDHRIWRVQSDREVRTPNKRIGGSSVQRDADAMILASAEEQLGLGPLSPLRIGVAPGASVEVDGAGDGVLVEVFARQGALKPAQRKKIAQDVLKSRVLRETVGYADHRMLIVSASDAARDSITGWVAFAARSARVELLVVDIAETWRERLRAAQAGQFMSSPLAFADVADDSADVILVGASDGS